MSANLVQRLRTCPKEERIYAAMELAQTGTDEAVAELVRMVEGKRRYCLRWYGQDDILPAIESLGETRNKKALGYLNNILECRPVSTPSQWSVANESGCCFMPVSVWMDYTFPNAPKRLAELIEYNGPVESDDLHGVSYQPTPLTKDEEIKIRQENRYHVAISSAIQKLESTLG